MPPRGARSAKTFPSVRLANWMALAHPYSVDLYGEKVLAHAKLVVVRLLGGASYWRYGLDEAVRLARANAIEARRHPGRRDLGRGARGARHRAGGGRRGSSGAISSRADRRISPTRLRYCAHLIGEGESRGGEALPSAGSTIGSPLPGRRWLRSSRVRGCARLLPTSQPLSRRCGTPSPKGRGDALRPPRSSSTARSCRPGRPSRSMRFARRWRSAG